MGAWEYRTNTALTIDPDFGKQAIPAGIIYKIDVAPANKKAKNWTFYLLMPKREEVDFELKEDSDEAQALAHIVERFLDQGDYYQVADVKDEDSAEFDNSTPILSYNPFSEEEEEWIWITPPKTARH
jgi:hypothetical protein